MNMVYKRYTLFCGITAIWIPQGSALGIHIAVIC